MSVNDDMFNNTFNENSLFGDGALPNIDINSIVSNIPNASTIDIGAIPIPSFPQTAVETPATPKLEEVEVETVVDKEKNVGESSEDKEIKASEENKMPEPTPIEKPNIVKAKEENKTEDTTVKKVSKSRKNTRKKTTEKEETTAETDDTSPKEIDYNEVAEYNGLDDIKSLSNVEVNEKFAEFKEEIDKKIAAIEVRNDMTNAVLKMMLEQIDEVMSIVFVRRVDYKTMADKLNTYIKWAEEIAKKNKVGKYEVLTNFKKSPKDKPTNLLAANEELMIYKTYTDEVWDKVNKQRYLLSDMIKLNK